MQDPYCLHLLEKSMYLVLSKGHWMELTTERKGTLNLILSMRTTMGLQGV